MTAIKSFFYVAHCEANSDLAGDGNECARMQHPVSGKITFFMMRPRRKSTNDFNALDWFHAVMDENRSIWEKIREIYQDQDWRRSSRFRKEINDFVGSDRFLIEHGSWMMMINTYKQTCAPCERNFGLLKRKWILNCYWSSFVSEKVLWTTRKLKILNDESLASQSLKTSLSSIQWWGLIRGIQISQIGEADGDCQQVLKHKNALKIVWSNLDSHKVK